MWGSELVTTNPTQSQSSRRCLVISILEVDVAAVSAVCVCVCVAEGGWRSESAGRREQMCAVLWRCVDQQGPGAAFVSPAFKSTRLHSSTPLLRPPLSQCPPSPPTLLGGTAVWNLCVCVEEGQPLLQPSLLQPPPSPHRWLLEVPAGRLLAD